MLTAENFKGRDLLPQIYELLLAFKCLCSWTFSPRIPTYFPLLSFPKFFSFSVLRNGLREKTHVFLYNLIRISEAGNRSGFFSHRTLFFFFISISRENEGTFSLDIYIKEPFFIRTFKI